MAPSTNTNGKWSVVHSDTATWLGYRKLPGWGSYRAVACPGKRRTRGASCSVLPTPPTTHRIITARQPEGASPSRMSCWWTGTYSGEDCETALSPIAARGSPAEVAEDNLGGLSLALEPPREATRHDMTSHDKTRQDKTGGFIRGLQRATTAKPLHACTK